MESQALVTNDAVVLGILMGILAFVFTTSHSDRRFWKRFYAIVPSLFVCYFLPSIVSTLGIVDGEASSLYFVSSRYLLPTSLVLLTLSIDLKGILRLGPKAGIMFLSGTVGIVIGGPAAILIVSWFDPSIVGGAGPDAVWRGLTTVAGSWIGHRRRGRSRRRVAGPDDGGGKLDRRRRQPDRDEGGLCRR